MVVKMISSLLQVTSAHKFCVYVCSTVLLQILAILRTSSKTVKTQLAHQVTVNNDGLYSFTCQRVKPKI